MKTCTITKNWLAGAANILWETERSTKHTRTFHSCVTTANAWVVGKAGK